MENRYKTKKLRVYLGKRTADYSTGAHSLADDLVRGSIIEKMRESAMWSVAKERHIYSPSSFDFG